MRAGSAAEQAVSGAWPLRRGFGVLSVLTVVTTYALIVLGGVVRATGSGDACPDWPRCHGQLIPPFETAVMIEFSHRLLASAVGFLVLAVAIIAWRHRKDYPIVAWAGLTAVAMVIGQIILGGLTVLNELPANLVMAHLAMASVLLAVLIVITFSVVVPPLKAADAVGFQSYAFRNQLIVVALAMLALMLTGSYVAGSGASLAYRDWPLFDGALWPDGGRLAVIHATHRFSVLAVGLLVAYVAAKAWRSHADDRPVLLGALFALTLYVAQAMVGAANIWTVLQAWAIAMHLALAALLWATLVTIALFAHRSAQVAAVDTRENEAPNRQAREKRGSTAVPAVESS